LRKAWSILEGYIRRRKFIELMGGAAVTWPLAAGAQQADREVRVGLLSVAATFSNSVFVAFLQEMRRLGYDDARSPTNFVRPLAM
jgi:hypothetical protein